MKVGFIGCGNMGGAIALAASKSSLNPQLYLTDHNAHKVDALCEKLSAHASMVTEIAERCDVIFLGVKPQVLPQLLEELAPMARPESVYISMAAGVTIEKLQNALGKDVPVIRIMPNTPVAVGSGMTLYDCGASVSEEQERAFLALMEQSGKVDRLEEAYIDAGCSVAGCGPAFAFLFAEALAQGGVSCGLPADKAIAYASQMLRGAADLLLVGDKTPEELRNAVCSKGGSTIRGVETLLDKGLCDMVASAVQASYKRNKELG